MITIPEDVLASMKLPEKDRERILKVELAMALFRGGFCPLARQENLLR